MRAIVYWGAVLIVSLAVVVALVLFLESRDASSIGSGAGGVWAWSPPAAGGESGAGGPRPG